MLVDTVTSLNLIVFADPVADLWITQLYCFGFFFLYKSVSYFIFSRFRDL